MQCALHVLNLTVCISAVKLLYFFAHCRDSFRRKFLHACFPALSSAFVLIIFTSDLPVWYAYRTRSGTRPEQVRTRHMPATGMGPVNFAGVNVHERVERDRNGTGTRTGTGVNTALGNKLSGLSTGLI